MAEETNAITDEELELERQELENQDTNSDVEEQNSEEQDENESGASADEDSQEEQENEQVEETDGAQEDAPTTPKQSRKERRAERAKRFTELRNDYQQKDKQRQQLTQRQAYNPIDYKQAEEFDVPQLEQDRNQYGDYQYSKGMADADYRATQREFHNSVVTEANLMANKKGFEFMNEDSETYSESLDNRMQQLFLASTNYDNNSGTYGNTSLRFADYAPYMKDMMEEYHQWRSEQDGEKQAQSEQNIKQQRSKAGIRPTAGASNASYRTYTPQQIAQMSPAQFDKHKADIDRQMQSMFN